MTTHWVQYARFALAAGTAVVLMGTCAAAQDRNWKKSINLTPEHLSEVDLHLLSSMRSVRDFVKFERNLPTHQEITVDWDSFPGQPEYMSWEQAARLALSPNFVVTGRRHNLDLGPWCACDLSPDHILIVGLDDRKQILGITEVYDGRLIRGLPGIPGAVRRRTTFTFNLPDDPQIKTAIILKADSRADELDGHRLVRVGEIDLQAAGSTGAAK